MKTKTFMAVMAVMLALSCQKTTRSSVDESTLNLTAPSGKVIAGSMDQLKSRTATMLAKQFGITQDFAVTGINYLNVPTGYAAILALRFGNGVEENLGIVSGIKISLPKSSEAVMISENQNSNNPDNPTYTVRCVGSCGCSLYMSYNRSSGQWNIFCDGCDECRATIIIQ